MAAVTLWIEVLSLGKALFDAVTSAIDFATAYKTHRHDPATEVEAARVSATFSTYSDAEVQALVTRLKGCQARFISQGAGADRRACFCSILEEAKEGNGGSLPQIDDWPRIFRTLGCGKKAPSPTQQFGNP